MTKLKTNPPATILAVSLPTSCTCLIVTPLHPDIWAEHLQEHPDPHFADYIISGIQSGFRIGFNHPMHHCHSSRRNMLSASQFPHIICKHLNTELALNKVQSHLSIQMCFQSIWGNSYKRHRENEWWLILDLSSLADHNINDGIDAATSSLHYSSVDHAVAMVRATERGVLLAKLNIKNAYHNTPVNIPVHPDNRWLLGMK